MAMLLAEFRAIPAADSRREALLDAAVELFSARTYESVSVDDLAKRAGVAHGMISYHFKNKRGLFAAAVATVYEDFVASESPTGDERLVRDVIRGYLKRHFAYVRRHPQRFSQLMRSGHADKEVNRIVDKARAAAMREIRSALGCPVEVPPPLSAAIRGWAAYVDAVTQRWLEDKSLDPTTVIEMCVQVLVASVAATKGLHFPAEVEEELLGTVASTPRASS
jgi:AcrR family transcriptional regulator